MIVRATVGYLDLLRLFPYIIPVKPNFRINPIELSVFWFSPQLDRRLINFELLTIYPHFSRFSIYINRNVSLLIRR